MWENASVTSAELLTRTAKNTQEKTCNNTCGVSEGGVAGARIQNVMGSFSSGLPLLFRVYDLSSTYSCCCCHRCLK